jgi:hypothetical protein
VYRWNPDFAKKKKNPDSPGRPLLQSYHVLAHGAGRSAEDQVGAGPDAGVPAVVPGGHLRVVRENEHRRREHSGLPQARGRGRVAGITPLPHMKAPDLRLVSLSLACAYCSPASRNKKKIKVQ